MAKWKHKVIDIEHDGEEWLAKLDTWGDSGWEVVGCYPYSINDAEHWYMVMKKKTGDD